MVLFAIDYGERYVGLAITDPDGRFAVRHSVVDQKKAAVLPGISAIVAVERVKRILVGVPLSLAGEETEQTHVSLAFIERLREVIPPDVEIVGVDETLTSVEAEQRIATEGGKPEETHAEAARLMLAEYLKTR